MNFRDYLPGDRAACLGLFDSNEARFFSPGDREAFERFLAELPGFFGVLSDADDQILGCGGIGQRGNNVVLTWGMIRADRQGQGLGKVLTLMRLERAWSIRGIERIVMNTSQETAGFYLKLGFRLVARHSNGYRPGLDRCELEMTRECWPALTNAGFEPEPG